MENENDQSTHDDEVSTSRSLKSNHSDDTSENVILNKPSQSKPTKRSIISNVSTDEASSEQNVESLENDDLSSKKRITEQQSQKNTYEYVDSDEASFEQNLESNKSNDISSDKRSNRQQLSELKYENTYSDNNSSEKNIGSNKSNDKLSDKHSKEQQLKGNQYEYTHSEEIPIEENIEIDKSNDKISDKYSKEQPAEEHNYDDTLFEDDLTESEMDDKQIDDEPKFEHMKSEDTTSENRINQQQSQENPHDFMPNDDDRTEPPIEKDQFWDASNNDDGSDESLKSDNSKLINSTSSSNNFYRKIQPPPLINDENLQSSLESPRIIITDRSHIENDDQDIKDQYLEQGSISSTIIKHTEESILRHESCQFQSDKSWLNCQYNDSNTDSIKKPDDVENEMSDPPETYDQTILDRIHGSLIGMALGDALGAHVEFRPRQYLVEHPVTELEGGGTWGLRKGQFTDDTSMALCLANSLIDRQDFIPYDQLVRYNWWYEKGYMSSTGECFDIGHATSSALKIFQDRQHTFSEEYKIPITQLDFLSDADVLKKFDVFCSTQGNAGNGALMRLAPVPLFFYKHPVDAVEFSGISGQITHGDQKAYDACRYYGALIVAALQGESKEAILDTQFYSKHIEWFSDKPLHEDIMKVAEGSYQKTGGYDDGIRGKGYIVSALEAALWAFWSDDGSFEKGALAAVNLGDDTDTTAAIYGQLAGAYYKHTALPSVWVEEVYAKKFIETISKWIAYEGKIWEPKPLTFVISHFPIQPDKPQTTVQSQSDSDSESKKSTTHKKSSSISSESEIEPSTNRSEIEPLANRSESESSTNRSEIKSLTNRSESESSTNRSEIKPSTNRSEIESLTNRSELDSTQQTRPVKEQFTRTSMETELENNTMMRNQYHDTASYTHSTYESELNDQSRSLSPKQTAVADLQEIPEKQEILISPTIAEVNVDRQSYDKASSRFQFDSTQKYDQTIEQFPDASMNTKIQANTMTHNRDSTIYNNEYSTYESKLNNQSRNLSPKQTAVADLQEIPEKREILTSPTIAEVNVDRQFYDNASSRFQFDSTKQNDQTIEQFPNASMNTKIQVNTMTHNRDPTTHNNEYSTYESRLNNQSRNFSLQQGFGFDSQATPTKKEVYTFSSKSEVNSDRPSYDKSSFQSKHYVDQQNFSTSSSTAQYTLYDSRMNSQTNNKDIDFHANLATWTVNDVCDWIKSFGKNYDNYVESFKTNNIDGYCLFMFTNEKILTQFGIKNPTHIQEILHRRELLKKEHQSVRWLLLKRR